MVEAAFLLCSYELSIRSLNSPWCFLFTEEDARVLEYKSDLKQFWKRFHGHVISGVSSCPLFHHVFRTLDKAGRPRRATDAPPALTASVLLGHAETLLPLLSLLGLYRDPHPPTADNYQQQHGRTFRSGLIVPYAANLLFVLFDCQRGPRLQLLLNEKPVRFPGLPTTTRRCTGTSAPRTAPCWMAATLHASVRAGGAVRPTQSSDWTGGGDI
ncbi:hypothetical protein F7725_013700 [Dissostichus mawsoni]|uniref:Multiple inositol polyphosphate phosphatase 1 n=1 Tax=Dissostichus mawsoni TaxID=36200 RepID=A0A7J5YTT4_DISMA|nr:hypothetical protein F7725_013700 [Dissostichus mawsoni]